MFRMGSKWNLLEGDKCCGEKLSREGVKWIGEKFVKKVIFINGGGRERVVWEREGWGYSYVICMFVVEICEFIVV